MDFDQILQERLILSFEEVHLGIIPVRFGQNPFIGLGDVIWSLHPKKLFIDPVT